MNDNKKDINDIDNILMSCGNIDEFKKRFCVKFVPSDEDEIYSEMQHYIDQDILATIFLDEKR